MTSNTFKYKDDVHTIPQIGDVIYIKRDLIDTKDYEAWKYLTVATVTGKPAIWENSVCMIPINFHRDGFIDRMVNLRIVSITMSSTIINDMVAL